MGSLDSEDASEMPLQVPKEIWLLVDHLFKHACHQVREETSAVLASSGELVDLVHRKQLEISSSLVSIG